MPADRSTILLTGFGPFPGIPANATSVLVPRIADAAVNAFAGTAVHAEILPTEWQAGLSRLTHLYATVQPSLALHFGVSSRASGFEIETRGRNFCQPAQDAAGCLPEHPCVTPDGPEFVPTSLPAAHIVARLRQRGLPASLSRDAGGYLCNALLYRSGELARRQPGPVRAGFVHLPSGLVHERNPARGPLSRCRLDWDDVIDGGIEIIAACLGRAPVVMRRPVARVTLRTP